MIELFLATLANARAVYKDLHHKGEISNPGSSLLAAIIFDSIGDYS